MSYTCILDWDHGINFCHFRKSLHEAKADPNSCCNAHSQLTQPVLTQVITLGYAALGVTISHKKAFNVL